MHVLTQALFYFSMTVPHHYANVEDYLVHYQKVRPLPPSVHIKPLIHASPLLIHLTDPSFYLLHSLPLSLQSIDDPAAFWAEIAHEFHWETPWEETGKEGGREGRRGRWDGMSRSGT